MDRRQFLRTGALAVGGGVVASSLSSRGAIAAMVRVPQPSSGATGYGALAAAPDANGFLLPAGFTSRVIAAAGDVLDNTTFVWPPHPDGIGTVATTDGGFVMFCNSNVFNVSPVGVGSVTAVAFGPDGTIHQAAQVLAGSQANSGGCVTPWGTWMSVEEDALYDHGQVWECSSAGGVNPKSLAALGRFSHGSIVVDPDGQQVYMTQAHPFGLLYRFTPTSYPDLAAGVLEACSVSPKGAVSWVPVPDPSASSQSVRDQLPNVAVFGSGGGLACADGMLWFTTTQDSAIHSVDLKAQTHQTIYIGDKADADANRNGFASGRALGYDAGTGMLLVSENGAAPTVMMVGRDGKAVPFAQLVGAGHEVSRLSGVAFDPLHQRLFVSSERGKTASSVGQLIAGLDANDFDGGVTYEISGPFASVAAPNVVVPPLGTVTPSSTVPGTASEGTPTEGSTGTGEAVVTTESPSHAETTEANSNETATSLVEAATTSVSAPSGGSSGGMGGALKGLMLGLVVVGGVFGGPKLLAKWKARPKKANDEDVDGMLEAVDEVAQAEGEGLSVEFGPRGADGDNVTGRRRGAPGAGGALPDDPHGVRPFGERAEDEERLATPVVYKGDGEHGEHGEEEHAAAAETST